MNIDQQQFNVCKATICPLMLVLLLGGCAIQKYSRPLSCPHSGSADKHITIVVNDEDKPEFKDNHCPPSGPYNKPGDICNGLNIKPDIRFILTGGNASTWEFVDFRLSEDGENWPGNLPLGVASDFQFASTADLKAGRPEWTVTGNTMHIENNNCFEFTVYYRLLLENPATGERRLVDPIIDNTGNNLE